MKTNIDRKHYTRGKENNAHTLARRRTHAHRNAPKHTHTRTPTPKTENEKPKKKKAWTHAWKHTNSKREEEIPSTLPSGREQDKCRIFRYGELPRQVIRICVDPTNKG